jgi:sulfonate transport system substrate-binding protein
MKIKSFIPLFSAAVLISGAIASAADAPKVIRYGAVGSGYGKAASTGPFAALVAKGWLDEEFKADGIKIEPNYFVGAGPAINEALANHSVDIACYGDLPAIIGKAAGLKTVVLASGGRDLLIYVAVPSNSNASSIEDLKGKRVGVFKGTYMHLTYDRVLDQLGLNEKSFNLINIRAADGENAVAAKDIDAYVGGNALLRLRDLGAAKIIYNSKGAPSDYQGQSVLVVQEPFLKKYPEVTKRFLKVWLKAQRWEADQANAKEAEFLDSKTGVPLAYIAEDRKGRSRKETWDPLFDDNFLNHFKFAVKFSKEHGLIRKEFDVDAWVNRDLQAQALQELGWKP